MPGLAITPEKERAIQPKQSESAVEPSSTAPAACIVGESPVRLWGLSSEERLRRQLAKLGVREWLNGEPRELSASSVVVLRADHLYDERILAGLVQNPGVLLELDDCSVAVAAHVPGELVREAERSLLTSTNGRLPGVEVTTAAALAGGYVRKLRKLEPATVLPIAPESRGWLEKRLFDGSYKGVTDLVTKWVWPVPARWVTGVCANLGIRPNHVTYASLVLAIAAIWLFAEGWFGLGLVVAWTMTFLDTVDGKLARVTVDSSQFGHYLDHGLDIVHPPLWYLAWGVGLEALPSPFSDLPLWEVFAAILGGYVVGRLVEGAFSQWLGRFSIFCWRPIDSYFRLIVARRNPSLIFLTVGLVVGRPDLGLLAVALWTVASALFLVGRLAFATGLKAARGPLGSWLEDPALLAGTVPWFARPFVKMPSTSGAGALRPPASHPRRAIIERRPAFAAPLELPRAVRTGVIVNPSSGRNARGRNLVRLRALVRAHDGVRHHEATAPEAIEQAVRECLAAETELLVVSGGDGTVQAVLTAMLSSDRPVLPVLAVLPGGTTNMTAGTLGLGGRQLRRLERLLDDAAAGRVRGVVAARPVLGVDFEPGGRTLYGLFLGGGAIEHLIRFYHRRIEALGMRNEAGPGVTFGFFLAKILLGHKGSLLPPVEIRGRADGEEIPGGAHLGFLATTLDRLFFGVRPFWGDEPGTIRYSALGYSPRRISRALLPILRGRRIPVATPENGYFSRRAHEIVLHVDGGFALDGEIYEPAPGTPIILRDDRRAFFLRDEGA
jgi:diacylglycerol kinase family enzyme